MTRNIPRIPFDQLPQGLSAALESRVNRLGYLGEFFQYTAHQPDALLSFIDYTAHSKESLPENLVEIIALTVACDRSNEYERNQHERLCIRLGFSRDWVLAVEKLDPEKQEILAPQEQRLQRFILESLQNDGHGVSNKLDALASELGPDAAIAVLMVIGRYLTHSLIVNSLELTPPVPSVFEDGFGLKTPN